MNKTAAIAVLAIGGVLLAGKGAVASFGQTLSPEQVHQIAVDTVQRHGLNADPCMLTAMAVVESGDKDRPQEGVDRFATRFEPHLPDTSTGIMQTLVGTAQWLHEIGYQAKPAPTLTRLYDPYSSMYYGAAYVDWLSRYGGRARGANWIIQSYNAGPGNTAGAYLRKYVTARANLERLGVC